MNIRESKIEYTLPLLAYENNMLISKSSDITRLFRVKLKEAYTISQTELNNSHIAWCKAIRCLPDYCIVHKQDIFQQKKYKGEKINGQKSEKRKKVLNEAEKKKQAVSPPPVGKPIPLWNASFVFQK